MAPIDLPRLAHEEPLNETSRAGVLVVGPTDWAIQEAESQLRAAGRVVHRCCDSVDAPFPCNALVPGRGCPLDDHDVGVVLDVRPRPRAEPTLGEMGAVCALRSGIPLVTAGVPELNAFAPWAQQVPANGDIVSTCDDALKATR